MSEEWFILLWMTILLDLWLFEVYQKSGLCCYGWLFCQTCDCLKFTRRVVYVAMDDYFVSYYCLKFTRRVVYIVMDDYFVSYYCLKFTRRVVYVVMDDYFVSLVTVWSLPEEWFMLLRMTILSAITVWSLPEEWCTVVAMVGYFVSYNYLKFPRKMLCVFSMWTNLSAITVWNLSEEWFMLLVLAIWPAIFTLIILLIKLTLENDKK